MFGYQTLGFGSGSHPAWNLEEIIRGLSLDTNLKLCLDAGEGDSYTSGQSWLDLAGSGYDFFLGQDGSSDSTDPTFNGVANTMTSSEYWSFDGGDYFTYDTTNETWMENLHKAGALLILVLCGIQGHQQG